MIRRRFLDDIEAIADGRDPKAIIRDPAANRAITLPVAEREKFIDGFARADFLSDPFSRRNLQGYMFQMGSPPRSGRNFLPRWASAKWKRLATQGPSTRWHRHRAHLSASRGRCPCGLR